MRELKPLYYDFVFQLRNGFYLAYIIIGLLYVVLLRVVPLPVRGIATVVLVFSDTAVLGSFFVGAIVLLEKSENTLDALFVTPFRPPRYILYKIIGLTTLSIVVSFGIVIAGFGYNFKGIQLLVGVVLSSILSTAFGLALSAKAKTVNEYFFRSIMYSFFVFIPLIDFIYDIPDWLFMIFPSGSSIILLKSAFYPESSSRVLLAVVIMILWICPVYIWALRWFDKYLVRKEI